ncbi:aldose 1-epimerase family protein [Sinomonas sp. R1AF57]|uniref:aldose 1-epimerase family protein n=1 Tax=Sinomonas sp. R1AF57 TaxID=2020377 RepID=UPI000B5F2CCB|nr:aldose 1-epimerase family protein [Sinomonas sp. R1AF57]ASN51405.1 aldose epimerase [Sinomonas sp. R1AF57]
MTSPSIPATGRQYELRSGGAVALVTELAATLRSYSRDGVVLTETFGDDQIPPGATGITLAPWANRIEDGRWTLEGRPQQLDLTEPSRGHASHGLLRNTGYALIGRSESSAVLEASVFPQHGYPFLVRHRVEYTLDGAGALSVTQSLTNHSPGRAPWVLGAHPYLRIGDVPTEDLVLTVPAATRLVADERLIPRSHEPAAGEDDLRRGRRVSELALDAAFTDLEFQDGRARSTLTAPDGRSVWLWQEAACRYVHVFVSVTFPGRTKAVALEPMTGPANAFNSGEGLGWLDPGETASMRWGIGSSL